MNRLKQHIGEGRAIFASVLCLLSCVLLLAPSAWAADARIVVNSGNSPYPLTKGKTYTAAEYGTYTPNRGAGSRDGGAAVKVEKGGILTGENVSFDGNKAYTKSTDWSTVANVYGGAINNEGGTVDLAGFTVFTSNACSSTDLTGGSQDNSCGGAIASALDNAECDASSTIDGAAAFSNNCVSCKKGGTTNGGAIGLRGRKISTGDKAGTICRSSLVINDNAVFLDNSAVNKDGKGTANGGAISLFPYCDLTIKGDATFQGNSAVAPNQNANGGAIYLFTDSTLKIGGKAVFDHNTVNGTNMIDRADSRATGGAFCGNSFREITFCDDVTFNGNGHSQGKKCNGGAMSLCVGSSESDPEVSIFNFSGIVELQTATDTWINKGGGYYAYQGPIGPGTEDARKDPNNYSLKKNTFEGQLESLRWVGALRFSQ